MSTFLIVNKEDFDLYFINGGHLNFNLNQLNHLEIKRKFNKSKKINLIVFLITFIYLVICSYMILVAICTCSFIYYFRYYYKSIYLVDILVHSKKYTFEVEGDMIDEFFQLKKKYKSIR